MRKLNPAFFTPREFAQMKRVHYNTVYRWIRNGDLPCKKIKICVRYRFLIPLNTPAPYLKPGPVPGSVGKRPKGHQPIPEPPIDRPPWE